MEQKIYTPDDVAQIFQISKHTVYELIKRGDLRAFKIGNKMRIEKEEIERFKEDQKAPASRKTEKPSLYSRLQLSGSHDLLVEQLVKYASTTNTPLQIQPTYIGSLEGLMMLYRGQCDIAAVHLLDPLSNEYNLPFIQQLFVHEKISLVRFAAREQGLMVSKGNPKGITRLQDLTRLDVKFINRQKGSGTRFLLDSLVAKEGIRPELIQGYENEEWNHLSTASYISRGSADVAFGIQSAAAQLGLDFIPVAKEQFDFVLKWTNDNETVLERFLAIVRDSQFQSFLHDTEGYDLENIGKIIY